MFAQLTAWSNGVQPNLNWTNCYPLSLTQECSAATVAGTKNVKVQRGRQKTDYDFDKVLGKGKIQHQPDTIPEEHRPQEPHSKWVTECR
jgi:hypothetical protein